MSFFQAAYAIVVGEIEKGYSNDPRDPGNWTSGKVGQGLLKGTKGGIAASAYPHLDIPNLTPEQIQGIYLTDYWQKAGCEAMSWERALCAFDCAVNQGEGAEELLQQHAHGDVLEFMTERAMRYAGSSKIGTFGHSWFHRLFLVMKAAQTTPSLPSS